MHTININKREGAKFITYPDSQPHVIVEFHPITNVVCSIVSCKVLFELLAVSSALDMVGSKKGTLFIPYLLGGRSDRTTQEGESVDLEIVAKLINQCGFSKVFLLDPHSTASTNLIWNSESVSGTFILERYEEEDAVIIQPDEGAGHRTKAALTKYPNKFAKYYGVATKTRNPLDGCLTIGVINPEVCKDKHCVIFDDICDGGGTFIGIAKQIEPKSLTLVVSHGIFSKGLDELEKYFDRIITTDSYPHGEDSETAFLTTINL